MLSPMLAPMGPLVRLRVSLVEVEVVLVPSSCRRESLTPQGSCSWSRGSGVVLSLLVDDALPVGPAGPRRVWAYSVF